MAPSRAKLRKNAMLWLVFVSNPPALILVDEANKASISVNDFSLII